MGKNKGERAVNGKAITEQELINEMVVGLLAKMQKDVRVPEREINRLDNENPSQLKKRATSILIGKIKSVFPRSHTDLEHQESITYLIGPNNLIVDKYVSYINESLVIAKAYIDGFNSGKVPQSQIVKESLAKAKNELKEKLTLIGERLASELRQNRVDRIEQTPLYQNKMPKKAKLTEEENQRKIDRKIDKKLEKLENKVYANLMAMLVTDSVVAESERKLRQKLVIDEINAKIRLLFSREEPKFDPLDFSNVEGRDDLQLTEIKVYIGKLTKKIEDFIDEYEPSNMVKPIIKRNLQAMENGLLGPVERVAAAPTLATRASGVSPSSGATYVTPGSSSRGRGTAPGWG